MFVLLIPINARAYDGAGRNPEYMVAGMTCVMALLGTGFYVSILKTTIFDINDNNFSNLGSNCKHVQTS